MMYMLNKDIDRHHNDKLDYLEKNQLGKLCCISELN